MLRHALGILLGLALTIGTVVLAFAAVALLAGDALGDPQSETINLDSFLWIELIAGTAGAMIGGATVLKYTSSIKASAVFAVILLLLGGLEAIALIASPEEIEGKPIELSPLLAVLPPLIGSIAAFAAALATHRWIGRQRRSTASISA